MVYAAKARAKRIVDHIEWLDLVALATSTIQIDLRPLDKEHPLQVRSVPVHKVTKSGGLQWTTKGVVYCSSNIAIPAIAPSPKDSFVIRIPTVPVYGSSP